VSFENELVPLNGCIAVCAGVNMQVSLPSQLERDNGGTDTGAVSASTSSTSSQSQKFPTPPVHRDIQRITANTNPPRRGMLQ